MTTNGDSKLNVDDPFALMDSSKSKPSTKQGDNTTVSHWQIDKSFMGLSVYSHHLDLYIFS